jgi:hypothetical protein
MIHDSGLAGVPDAEFTIIVSGEITADTGGGNAMVEIGGGYPHIILKGFDTGTNAIDATGKNKSVLFIDGAKVSLEDNLILMGGSTGYFGGGVIVAGSGSAFTMTGGFIQYNTASTSGGGVCVDNGGTFTMTGGFIENNTAVYGGGVYVYNGCAFTMGGNAVIQNNTVSYHGGGVYAGGTFDMTGGVIEENEAIGSVSAVGGGVYLSNGTFTMGGTAVIKDNTTSTYGGGVFVDDGIFTMDGGVIEENTADLSGGGVYMPGGTFTMTGGFIQDNTADGGGGVQMSYGTFTKTGGTIAGSDIVSDGQAVYLSGGKKRNTTAGPLVNLYAANSGSGWSYGDFPSPPGIGETIGNWE